VAIVLLARSAVGQGTVQSLVAAERQESRGRAQLRWLSRYIEAAMLDVGEEEEPKTSAGETKPRSTKQHNKLIGR
jgi:hypothetical protein